jgi:hypothetical protein
LTLPVEERAQVAHELLRSLDSQDPDATVAWSDEIRRHIDEVEAGTAQLDDWTPSRLASKLLAEGEHHLALRSQ